MRTARCWVCIARFTSPMILFITRNFISRPAIWVFSWQTKYGKIGVLVCWDQWYPEAARLTAMQGAEILFYPTAIGWHPEEKKEYGQIQHDQWETIQRAPAIANGCYVAVPNRVGVEKPGNRDGTQLWGQSFVA